MTTTTPPVPDTGRDELHDLVRDPDDVCHVFNAARELSYCGIPRSEVTRVHGGIIPWKGRYDYKCVQCGGKLCKPCWDACMRCNGWL